ncbi:hypothetical protein T484DRAFT_1769634, partial [Baffinella frigidus]
GERKLVAEEKEAAKREEGALRDELATDVRAKVESEKQYQPPCCPDAATDVRAKVEAETQVERGRRDLEDLRRQLAPIQREQLALAEEIRRLEERRTNADKVEETQTGVLEKLRTEYRDAEKAKREREAETLDLRKKLNSKEFTVEEQVADLERLRKEELERRTDIERRIAEKQAEMPKYEREEVEMRKELQKLGGEHATIRERTTKARDEVDAWRISDELLRAEQAEVLEELTDLQRNKAPPLPSLYPFDIHGWMNSWPKREDAMKKEISSIQEGLENLEDREVTSRKESDVLSGQLIERTHEVGLVEKELLKIRENVALADGNIERLVQERTEAERRRFELAAREEQRGREAREAAEDLAVAEKGLAEDEAKLNERAEELRAARERHDMAKGTVEKDLKELQQDAGRANAE